ncbi:Nn.00g038620.m01.CDS01 [Neocucurbitaria sp. VM-36]
MFFPAILSKPTALFPSFIVGNGKKGVKPVTGQNARVFGVWDGIVDEQEQCGFLFRLPAEIRNEIYEYVFAEEVDSEVGMEKEKQNQETNEQEKGSDIICFTPLLPSHPLSLLLSCRKINMEASIIAYRLNAFSVKEHLTFHELRQRSSILPQPLFRAISRMSFALGKQKRSSPFWHDAMKKFLIHTIRLSPNIKELVIRIWTPVECKDPWLIGVPLNYRPIVPWKGHVPEWFISALDAVIQDRSNFWHRGEKWAVLWPNLSPRAVDDIQHGDVESQPFAHGACTAILEQHGSGRKVEVKLRFEKDDTNFPEPKPKGLGVRLVPGLAEKLKLETVSVEGGMDGLMYEPGEEYWEALRARKGKG